MHAGPSRSAGCHHAVTVRSILALAALGAAAFCFVGGENLPVSLLPLLSSGLGVSLSVAGLLVTVYAVTVVVASAPLTHLTRRLSRRALLAGLLAVFVVGTVGAAAAPGYGWMVAARVVTALAQAVFWSIAAVVAAGMFPAAARGRALAGMYAGSTVALVAAVPAGNWLGEMAGWRLPFVLLGGAGVLVLAALLLLLPRPAEGGGSLSRPGADPDGRRYAAILLTTLLCVAGFFTANTYITAFLTRVAGVPADRVALILALAGVADAAGLAAFGHLVDRRARLAGPAATGLLAASLIGLFAGGTSVVGAAVLEASLSFGLSGVVLFLQSEVLVVAPWRADISTAWFSATFNVGIGTGPLVGALVLATLGLRATALAGALIAALGVIAAGLGVRERRGTLALTGVAAEVPGCTVG